MKAPMERNKIDPYICPRCGHVMELVPKGTTWEFQCAFCSDAPIWYRMTNKTEVNDGDERASNHTL